MSANRAKIIPVLLVVALCALFGVFFSCSQGPQPVAVRESLEANDAPANEERSASASSSSSMLEAPTASASEAPERSEVTEPDSKKPSASALFGELGVIEDYRPSFVHGEKGAAYQKYIMLHDTEGESSPESVVDFWDGNGNLVAAHFVVGKDGSIVQCVPLDNIAHHAGYGDAGHNDLYGIVEDGRDDMLGSVPIGSWAPDYGMNAWSVGIEMVHVGGTGYYPEEQLAAVDRLIAYIDAYYGFESAIVDHKAWRSGNSDTSPEFAAYLANYQDHRTHL